MNRPVISGWRSQRHFTREARRSMRIQGKRVNLQMLSALSMHSQTSRMECLGSPAFRCLPKSKAKKVHSWRAWRIAGSFSEKFARVTSWSNVECVGMFIACAEVDRTRWRVTRTWGEQKHKLRQACAYDCCALSKEASEVLSRVQSFPFGCKILCVHASSWIPQTLGNSKRKNEGSWITPKAHMSGASCWSCCYQGEGGSCLQR